MFYVIRDDYRGYDYEIVLERENINEAFCDMVRDIASFCKKDFDIDAVTREALKDGYEDEDVKIWVLGGVCNDICRWGITEYNKK